MLSVGLGLEKNTVQDAGKYGSVALHRQAGGGTRLLTRYDIADPTC